MPLPNKRHAAGDECQTVKIAGLALALAGTPFWDIAGSLPILGYPSESEPRAERERPEQKPKRP